MAEAHLAINGGAATCSVEWPRWPVWDDGERQGLSDVLESGDWWYGRKVQEFEQRFAEFQGARFGITCTNGTAGLEVALLALGIGAGDEVIVPPYTFIATASAVLRANAVPVFADIDAATLCIDPADVERKITARTRAVIPVHVAGYIADMDRLGAIAEGHGLALIEDACHAWGSQWKGKGAGGVGDCGVFSFQASKNITSGEGGIILTDDQQLADLCRSYTNCGRRDGEAWYKHFVLGGNLRLTEFQAAILLAQLGRLEEQTMRRQDNAALLDAGLRETLGITTLAPEQRMTRRSYHFYPFRVDVDALGTTRDHFVQALKAEGIPCSAGWPTPLYRNPLFEAQGYGSISCPVCEQVCSDACWIPHNVLLAGAGEMQSIVEAVRKVCAYSEEISE